MRKLIALLFLTVVVAGIAGLAVNSERASAGVPVPPHDSRFDLNCRQVVAPGEITEFPNVGIVKCTLTIDLPDALTPPLPDTITLQITAAYRDVDGNGRPSPGDRLLCIRVTGPNIDFQRCRGGIEIPPGLTLPG